MLVQEEGKKEQEEEWVWLGGEFVFCFVWSICLAALGLSCSMWDLKHADS